MVNDRQGHLGQVCEPPQFVQQSQFCFRTELSVRNRWNAHLRARVESSGMSEAAYAQRLLCAVEFGGD